MTKSIYAFVFLASAFLVSCQKESSEPQTTDITGTWNFVSMDVNTTTTMEVQDGSDEMKSITTAAYTTENNSGTITFDAANMSYNDLTYAVNTTLQIKMYRNGGLFSSDNLPFTFTMPYPARQRNTRLYPPILFISQKEWELHH